MNLLLVDDEVAMVQIMKEAVDWKKQGIKELYTAHNAYEAKDILESTKIDILVCDIEMPGESGLELIKWMEDIYPEILSIILTGYPDFNYARSAVSLGVYQYLLKPVAFEELDEVVHHAVERVEEIISSRNRKDMTGIEEMSDPVRVIKEYLEIHYNEVITRKNI